MNKIIVANWKMYLAPKKSIDFFGEILNPKSEILNPKLEIIICPSFLVLETIQKFIIHNSKFIIQLGAQDCFWEERGAYTGEISPADLKEMGCEYVIIGHSERRRYFKETDQMISRKIKAALKAGLKPIFCVGESKSERAKGQAAGRVKSQLAKGLAGLSLEKETNLLVAYEPVWAIGTGDFCPAGEAVKMHRLIKKEAGRLLSVKNIPVLYGGSVDDKNVVDYLKHPEIDGVLVGGASAKQESFAPLLKNVNQYSF